MTLPPHGPGTTQAPRLPTGPDGNRTTESLRRKWMVLHGAAAVIAMLADEIASDPFDDAGFHARLERIAPARRGLIDEQLSDLIAVMEPGLVALLAIRRVNGDASASAGALLREFRRARAAIGALLV